MIDGKTDDELLSHNSKQEERSSFISYLSIGRLPSLNTYHSNWSRLFSHSFPASDRLDSFYFSSSFLSKMPRPAFFILFKEFPSDRSTQALEKEEGKG